MKGKVNKFQRLYWEVLLEEENKKPNSNGSVTLDEQEPMTITSD